jgi:hypothetical protein
MLESILVALLVGAGSPRLSCDTRCPCVVPTGVDWHSAAAMVPRSPRAASAVFLGRVIAVDTVARDTSPPAPHSTQFPGRVIRVRAVRYTFAVQRSWKGPRTRELQVASYDVDTSCGREYTAAASYLVYADEDRRRAASNGLSTYSCSRALLATQAGEDLELLGAGRAPRD